jgi:acetate---CoA ligase (ADP-forming)
MTTVDVELRDGSTVRVRPVRPDDHEALVALLRDLSPDARRYRFFGQVDLEGAARAMALGGGSEDHALVALTGVPERIIGHAQYLRDPRSPVAEVAFTVADAFQGRGLGTLLLAHLAEHAHAAGVEELDAEVMADNRRMIDMFRDSGFPVILRRESGTAFVRFPASLGPTAMAAFEARQRTAAASMVRRILAPRSVAVIGASRSRGTVGGEVLHHLREGGFPGTIHPVNAAADEVQGMAALRRVDDLPEGVDLAVVAVPAAGVLDVARACGARGVGALVALTAGFAEVGEAGAGLQRDLIGICRATGMRLVGPNCLGVISTAPGTPLNATFASAMPPRGTIGLLSQSGGLGIALLEQARELGVGLSSFVSVGNKADVSGNDLRRYWEDDPETEVVLLYLESFGNPRTFARVARRLTRSKPVVAVKSARGRAGARAAGSHTGALVSGSDATVDALFRQAGVIRATTMGEQFDVAKLLAGQPLPPGRRVAILTNAGGPGILCADACEAGGLDVVELPAGLRERLRAIAAPEASVANPVDLLAAATPEAFGRALAELATGEAADAVIVIYIQPGLGSVGAEVAAEVRTVTERLRPPVPVLAVLMSASDREAALASAGPGAPPVYAYPEAAALALARVSEYAAWRARPPGVVPELEGTRPEHAATLLSAATVAGSEWLTSREIAALFACYGLPLVETAVVAGPAEAGAAAARIGGPVALKAVAPGLVHKSDVGAVRLGMEGGEAVTAAAVAMESSLAALGQRVEGFMVQPMVAGGVEMLIGSTTDPQFGPVVACGLGGTAAEVHRDVAVRLTPLTDLGAHMMLRGLRMLPLLQGYRGAPACDIAALEELVLRVAAMVHAHPQIVELDCNPVSVTPERIVILDARVRVAAAPAAVPWPSLGAAPPVAWPAGAP